MVTEKKVRAKTSLTFASCYCFWKHGFIPLQKFLWKADVTHFLFRFCQRFMAIVEVIILTGKESYLCLDYKKINRNPMSPFASSALNSSPLAAPR